MNVTWKENQGNRMELKFERDVRFRHLIRTTSDEQLPSFLSQPNQKKKLRWEICDEMIQFMDILCLYGYLNSLKFFHKHFQEIGGLKLSDNALKVCRGKETHKKYCEALNKYCFGPKPLCTAIYNGQADIVQYFLGAQTHTVQYYLEAQSHK